MIILSWIFLGASLALSISFLVWSSRHKDETYRQTYLYWGLAFLLLAMQEGSFLLSKAGILNLNAAKELPAILWLGFLVLLYCGTIYIFAKKIFIALTYILLASALMAATMTVLLPSQTPYIALFAGLAVIIPTQLVVGIFSWFLGLSLFRDPSALVAYWTIGAAWILYSVTVGWTAASPVFASSESWQSVFYEYGITDYISSLAEMMLLAAYLVLLWRRVKHNKECF